MKYKSGGTTTWIGKNLYNAVNSYDEKIYTNVKYRNIYVENSENKVINNDIIRVMRGAGGYNFNLLNKQEYLKSYNVGWKKVSIVRKVVKEHNTMDIAIKMGGTDSYGTSHEYEIDFDDVYLINLTEIFGKGNEPTKEKMDEIFNEF